MSETIYTIPINDAFSESDGCPLCKLTSMLCENELDIILGAAMMEPDIRMKTNKVGFCPEHFSMMQKKQKKLPLTLMLQSHFIEINKQIFSKKSASSLFSSPEKDAEYLNKLSESCYICERVSTNTKRLYSNIFHLVRTDPDFIAKLKNQTMYCLPHYEALLKEGAKYLSKKDYAKFSDIIFATEKEYMKKLTDDLDWFCRKFDYRNRDAEFGTAKDAPERAIYTLTGKKP